MVAFDYSWMVGNPEVSFGEAIHFDELFEC
jgi:hypothetical protein